MKKDIHKPVTLRSIWGLAKSPDLSLTDEELHLLVQAHTGKDSLRKLTEYEIQEMVRVLARMKDSCNGRKKQPYNQRGNEATRRQRAKVYKLAQELGWDSVKRVNGFARKMYGVASVEWLDYGQCSGMIEAMKKMAERSRNGEQGKGTGAEAAGEAGQAHRDGSGRRTGAQAADR